MDRYHSERLIKQFGFEKGLDLLNVLAARELGMIPEKHAIRVLRDNIHFFTRSEEPALR